MILDSSNGVTHASSMLPARSRNPLTAVKDWYNNRERTPSLIQSVKEMHMFIDDGIPVKRTPSVTDTSDPYTHIPGKSTDPFQVDPIQSTIVRRIQEQSGSIPLKTPQEVSIQKFSNSLTAVLTKLKFEITSWSVEKQAKEITVKGMVIVFGDIPEQYRSVVATYCEAIVREQYDWFPLINETKLPVHFDVKWNAGVV